MEENLPTTIGNIKFLINNFVSFCLAEGFQNCSEGGMQSGLSKAILTLLPWSLDTEGQNPPQSSDSLSQIRKDTMTKAFYNLQPKFTRQQEKGMCAQQCQRALPAQDGGNESNIKTLRQESEFIQQVFTEPLLYAKHYFMCQEYIPLIKKYKIPVFIVLTLQRKDTKQ